MSAKSKPQVITPTETKFNLKLGEKIYTLNFGTATFKRIQEACPKLTTAFHVLDELSPFEAVPLLIESAIKPEDRDWTTRDEFLDLYDECNDPSINKVLTAYISAAGFNTKKLKPVLESVAEMQTASEEK